MGFRTAHTLHDSEIQPMRRPSACYIYRRTYTASTHHGVSVGGKYLWRLGIAGGEHGTGCGEFAEVGHGRLELRRGVVEDTPVHLICSSGPKLQCAVCSVQCLIETHAQLLSAVEHQHDEDAVPCTVRQWHRHYTVARPCKQAWERVARPCKQTWERASMS